MRFRKEREERLNVALLAGDMLADLIGVTLIE